MRDPAPKSCTGVPAYRCVHARYGAARDILARMQPASVPTLYLLCGRIAAGKSTLARQLAARPATLLLVMDDWMSTLFPVENRTIEDFTELSARLRAIMAPHVAALLRRGVSVVLDFPANTVRWRAWMRSIITEANVAHELHFLDIPDAVCRERLRQRNGSGADPYQVDEATYDQFMHYFVPPGPDEDFNIVVHTVGGRSA
jgi:predicted kinase